MTRRTYVEVCCDNCEAMIDHLSPPGITEKLRTLSNAVVYKGRDFCDDKCRDQYTEKNKGKGK